MPRYKLRVPQTGDPLHWDDGTEAVVADTLAAARAEWDSMYGEPAPQYLHSEIGRCQIVYARDIENCDAHEDAQPGDTTYWMGTDDGRELRANEFRCWLAGPPHVGWKMEPLPPEPVEVAEIPVGVQVRHDRLGSGVTVSKPRRIYPKCWYVDVEFSRWNGRDVGPLPHIDKKTVACRVDSERVHLMRSMHWPLTRYRLTVNGEFVAEGTERMLDSLRDVRINRINAEWEAEQDRLRSAA